MIIQQTFEIVTMILTVFQKIFHIRNKWTICRVVDLQSGALSGHEKKNVASASSRMQQVSVMLL